jgi:AraC-like DNA-binding protein/predicted transcriptional regulator YdeE
MYIQKAIDRIEQNLSEKMEMSILSGSVYLSPFYFQRLFKRMTGRTVMEYIKLRRLAYAADYLARSPDKISEVALKSGFENHETFTRSFKEVYGVTPSAYREQKLSVASFKALDLSGQYFLKNLNIPLVADGIVFDIKRIQQQSERYFDTSASDYANASTELDTVFKPKNFTGWYIPIGDYIVCCFECESRQQLVSEACPAVKKYILYSWAKENRVSLNLIEKIVVYSNLPDLIFVEMLFTINTNKEEFSMYSPKTEVQLITLDYDIKVVGINLQNSGLPISFESLAKLWDKKEVYTEEIQNNTKNTKRPVIEYGIGLNTIHDYVVGREVTEFGEQDERYFAYTIPAGKYVKTSFNAETFEEMVEKRLFEHYDTGKNWAKDNGFTIDESFSAEVYPHETTMVQYPEMYLLYPVKD